MPKRVTDNEFKRRVRQIHGDQFTFFSTYHGMCSKVKVRCNKCGWIGEVRTANLIHRNYGSRCPKHGKRQFDSSSFQKAINQTQDGQYTLLSEYTGYESKVKVKCNKCGWIGEVIADPLLHRNYGSRCPKHGKRQFDSSSFRKAINQTQDGQYTLLSEYTGFKAKVKIKCNKCGKEFCAWPESLLRKHMGKNCNHKKSNHRSILNFKQASKRLNKISNGEIKLVRFSDMHSVATFECCKCGNVWRATAYNIFYNLTGCPTCSSSKGEKCVRKYLKGKNIPFEEQFKIKKCKDILPLPFDFAVFNADKSLNCLIEYQGCQHFYNPFSWKRSHGPFNTKSVLSTQKHDAMKLSFCKEHGIKLIRINHPQTDSKFDKYSFIANLVKRTLNKELKVS